jgi:SAM-dependent methyltransferase
LNDLKGYRDYWVNLEEQEYILDIDWIALWRNLIKANSKLKPIGYISGYEGRPDSLLDFALHDIGKVNSALDIGAGAGRWTIPLAKIASSVTAVEPSETMLDNLRKNIASAGVDNIHIVPARWQDAKVESHDVVICAHGIYSSADFPAFIRKMEQSAIRRCYLELRLPPVDGIIGELHRRIYGHVYDSPNAIIAYNALYELGIYADVKIEDSSEHWMDNSIGEALVRAKRYLRLENTNEYDTLVRDTLERRLSCSNDVYIWPDGMRSALFWWKVPSA